MGADLLLHALPEVDFIMGLRNITHVATNALNLVQNIHTFQTAVLQHEGNAAMFDFVNILGGGVGELPLAGAGFDKLAAVFVSSMYRHSCQ